MRAVRSKNTKPEILVRKAAHRMGLRFRIHRSNLPGRPDLVFPKRRTVAFVNGCFWHAHPRCSRAALPKSNIDFWREKIAENRLRDRRNYARLKKLGWKVVVIWQCEIKNFEAALEKVAAEIL